MTKPTGPKYLITLKPADDDNRDTVLAMPVLIDQPFVAPNGISLKDAEELNAG